MKTLRLSFFFATAIISTHCESNQCDPPTCFGDLTCDGVVGTNDLLTLLEAWGLTANGDLSGNGTTGSYDLVLLLGEYGTYCPETNTTEQ